MAYFYNTCIIVLLSAIKIDVSIGRHPGLRNRNSETFKYKPIIKDTKFEQTFRNDPEVKRGVVFDPNNWGFSLYDPNKGMDNYLGIVTNTDLTGPVAESTHSNTKPEVNNGQTHNGGFNPNSLNAFLMTSFMKPETGMTGKDVFPNLVQPFDPSTVNGQAFQDIKYNPSQINQQLIPQPSYGQGFSGQGMDFPNMFFPQSSAHSLYAQKTSTTHASTPAQTTVQTTEAANEEKGGGENNNETDLNVPGTTANSNTDNSEVEVHPTNDVVGNQEGKTENNHQEGNGPFPAAAANGVVSIDPQSGHVSGFTNTNPMLQAGSQGYSNTQMIGGVGGNGSVHATGIGGLGTMDNVVTGYVKYENQIGPEVQESKHPMGTGNFTSANVVATGIGSLGTNMGTAQTQNIGLPEFQIDPENGFNNGGSQVQVSGIGSLGPMTSLKGDNSFVNNQTEVSGIGSGNLTQYSITHGLPVQAIGIGSLDGKTGNNLTFTGTSYAHVANVGGNPEVKGTPGSNVSAAGSENVDFLKDLLGEEMFKQLQLSVK